jgi:error-prone DNA polymerase
MADFAHLHVHSYFSLLDGAVSPRELARRASELGMTSVAVTDHNTLGGAVRFYQAAQSAGIKPIAGVEFTVELTGDKPLPPLQPPGYNGSVRPTDSRPDTTTDYTRYAHLVLLAQDNEGYANLCRLVTCAHLGKAQHSGPFSKEFAHLDRKKPVLLQEHLREYAGHLICLSGCEKGEIPRRLAAGQWQEAQESADYYHQVFGADCFYVELQNNLLPAPPRGLRYRLQNLADHLNLPVVATNNVHYATRDYARAQDVLVCIRALQTVNEYHPDRKVNAEYSLKSPAEMAALFPDQPEALRNTLLIAERCNWTLDLETFHFPRFLPQDYPHEIAAPTATFDSEAFLRTLCFDQARRLYGSGGTVDRATQVDEEGLPMPVRQRLEHELKIITEQGLCDYFLIVWDLCRFARARGIMTTGRGSAGDSLVSYLLEITSVDPLAHDLLFERFLNPQRRQMPDIDVDFDSRRRDEVVAYVYERYGPEQVAAVCTVNTFRARSAVREVGKALGMDEEELGTLAETLPHLRASDIAEATQRFPEVRDANLNLQDKALLLELCDHISGFPRHLSVHVGGLVIGAEPLTNRISLALAQKGIVIAEFDKDDVEALGLVKMDILGLRTHTAISDCLEMIARRTGKRIDLERVSLDDETTFELLRSTQTIGLFQLESPGQRNLLGRAQPREFEEVIANISLFRPGPVQSDMIRPYLRRKHGLEPVVYLHPSLEPILHRTYGVLIYQEQVLEIAAALAGFTLGEADQLRRLMTSDRSREEMAKLGDAFIDKAVARGIERPVAEEVFHQVSGFAAYGFCKAHAACFGKISYQTAWLKAHYPAEYLAGILSAEPMGFYPSRTIAEEAKRLGIALLPPSVNRSEASFSVEDAAAGKDALETAQGVALAGRHEPRPPAIRVGLRLLRGMSERALQSILQARARGGAFCSLRDFCERTHVPRPTVENLILARAFAFTGYTEQELLWLLAGHRPETSETHTRLIGEQPASCEEILTALPELDPTTPVGRVALDLNLCGVSTTVNPFSFWRERMAELGVIPSTDLYQYENGDMVRVAGIVVARARPPTRSGKTAIFISLEDDRGLVDVAVFEECYQRCGRALYASPVLCVEGKLTRLGALDLSVTAQQVLGMGSWRDFERPLSRAGKPWARTKAKASESRSRLVPHQHTPVAMSPQQGNDLRSLYNRLMDRWEPRPNAKVGERRG